MFSARWDGSLWGPPERIEDREIDPHGQEIAICQGNKLQVVYDDRNDSQKIWYSNRTVEAPKLNRQALPFQEPLTTESSSLAGTSILTPEYAEEQTQEPQEPIEIPQSANQNPANPLTPLLVASGIVIALIVTVIIIKRR